MKTFLSIHALLVAAGCFCLGAVKAEEAKEPVKAKEAAKADAEESDAALEIARSQCSSVLIWGLDLLPLCTYDGWDAQSIQKGAQAYAQFSCEAETANHKSDQAMFTMAQKRRRHFLEGSLKPAQIQQFLELKGISHLVDDHGAEANDGYVHSAGETLVKISHKPTALDAQGESGEKVSLEDLSEILGKMANEPRLNYPDIRSAVALAQKAIKQHPLKAQALVQQLTETLRKYDASSLEAAMAAEVKKLAKMQEAAKSKDSAKTKDKAKEPAKTDKEKTTELYVNELARCHNVLQWSLDLLPLCNDEAWDVQAITKAAQAHAQYECETELARQKHDVKHADLKLSAEAKKRCRQFLEAALTPVQIQQLRELKGVSDLISKRDEKAGDGYAECYGAIMIGIISASPVMNPKEISGWKVTLEDLSDILEAMTSEPRLDYPEIQSAVALAQKAIKQHPQKAEALVQQLTETLRKYDVPW